MSNPQISIIVPVYNVEPWLRTCLDSILAQSFTDFEAICVNDGSPDNSAAILKEYAEKDSRIKVITQANGGLSAARNTGLEQASGEFIYFLDSDDYIHPQLLEILYREINSGEYDFSGCAYQKVEGTQKTFPHYKNYRTKVVTAPLATFCKNKKLLPINVWSKLYRRKTLGDLRFISGLIYEDLPFSCAFMAQSQSGKMVDLPLYYYLLRGGSLSGNKEIKLKNCQSYIFILRHLHEKFCTDKLSPFVHERFFRSILKTLLRLRKNVETETYVKEELQKLLDEKIISYADLSLRYRLKLWLLLHKK